jgi:two-component system CAI-1 autoinducer sensor kinase/phosphatase CqsS
VRVAPLPSWRLHRPGGAAARELTEPRVCGKGFTVLMPWRSKWWRGLYDEFEAYHAYGPPRLVYMSYIGIAGYALFYLLRFTRPNPDPYEDVLLRAGCLLLFLGLALRDRWPARLMPYYTAYAYVSLVLCLPAMAVYRGLERGGGMPSVSNCFIVLVFLILLTDWRNTIVMILIGTGVASLAYYLTTPAPHIPMDMVAQIPAFALIVVGGNLFKVSSEQLDTERKLKATQALAGSIAHEMRNPLGQIRHVFERMRQELPAPSSHAQPQTLEARSIDAFYRHLADGEVAVSRGLQVITMTLDEVTAKPLDSGSFVPLSAADASRKAVLEYGYDSEEESARVKLVVIEDFEFRGEETAYLFVLFNLIKNSLYYVKLRDDGLVTITVQKNEVRVRDNGPGLAPDSMEHLFEPFRSAAKAGGTGLGLTYCKRVMTAFGGSIEAQSELGKFTEFTLRLPVVSAEESHDYSVGVLQVARSTFQGKRLLVVDDSASMRASTVRHLRPLAAHIDEVSDGSLALDLLAANKYDLVVLDLSMPVLDGYDVCDRIRHGKVPLNTDVCVLAFTSEPERSVRVKAEKAGMDGCLTKPCSPLQLLQAMVTAYQRPTARQRPAGAPLSGRQVLLADDNPYNRKAMAAYLHEVGIDVMEAAHGQAVLDLLAAGGGMWDAVLLDLSMPGKGGLETALEIRRGKTPSANVPIIALTAHSDEATVSAARKAGMNGFLIKPVDQGVLYQKLREVLGHRAAAAKGDGSQEIAAPQELAAIASPDAAPADPAALLNLKRLESFRRIGLVEELLRDYFKESARLIGVLEEANDMQSEQRCRDALHSLLGMSAEAGAASLHQLVRRIYVPLVEENRWPLEEGWLDQIRTQAACTDASLRAYCEANAPSANVK